MKIVYAGQSIEANKLVNYDYIEIKYKDMYYITRSRIVNIPYDPIKYNYRKDMIGYDRINNTDYTDDSKTHDNTDCNDIDDSTDDVIDKTHDDILDSTDDVIDKTHDKTHDNILDSTDYNDIYKTHDIDDVIDYTNNEIINTSREDDMSDNIKYNIDEIISKNNFSNRRKLEKINVFDDKLIMNYIKEDYVESHEGLLKYNEFVDFRIRKRKIVHCEVYIVRNPFNVFVTRADNMTTIEIERYMRCRLIVDSDRGVVCCNDGVYKIHGNPAIITILAMTEKGPVLKKIFF